MGRWGLRVLGGGPGTLNRAVAVAMATAAGWPDLLATLDDDERMTRQHRLDAVRAHLLEMAGEGSNPRAPLPGTPRGPACRSARAGNHPCRNQQNRRRVDRGMAKGHTITITPASRHLEVTLGGEKLAVSDRPVLLDETGLPTRYYLPPEDVRTELLRPTSSETTCPFKGQASYWSVVLGEEVHDDIVWSYQEPIPQAAGIAGLMCFYTEKVQLTIDGVGAPDSA